ncbi:MAG: hypothetical protein GX639_12140 [Fibrobacter sp.]|nr:hypothetical protein [Fibrobacter sp.]
MKELREDPVSKFKPSPISAPGFLGSDTGTASIRDIIDTDYALLEECGLTTEKVAQALELIYRKCELAMGDPVTFPNGITGELIDIRGKLPCPFGKCGTFAKGQVTLSGGVLHAPLIISPLSLHLIKTHGFFQGTSSPFRIDPRIVAEHLMTVALP